MSRYRPSITFETGILQILPPKYSISLSTYLPDLNKPSLAEFLEESIRFYNFFTDGIDKGSGWNQITTKKLSNLTRELRAAFHTALRENIHDLTRLRINDKRTSKEKKESPVRFTDYYNEKNKFFKDRKRNFFYRDNANRARFSVRIFLSDKYRTDLFVEHNPQKKEFHGIKLEKQTKRLTILRKNILEIYNNKPRQPTHTINYKYEGIFYSALSKDRTISRDFFTKQRLSWLTEHLYLCSGHPEFDGVDLSTNTIPEGFEQINSIIDEIEKGLSSLNSDSNVRSVMTTWNEWKLGLDYLESYFGSRVLSTKANEFGLEWALFLIYVLRWYLTELKLRIFLTSLPIFSFYDTKKRNSYSGICLWEALSGSSLPHPSIPNLIDIEMASEEEYSLKESHKRHEKNDQLQIYLIQKQSLKGILKDWPTAAGTTILKNTKTTYHISESESLIKDFASKPIILSSSIEEGKRIFESVSVGCFQEKIYSKDNLPNPIIYRKSGLKSRNQTQYRPDYYSVTGFNRYPKNELHFGASFSSQLQLFVAASFLNKIEELFGLRTFYKKQYNDNKSKKTEKRKLKQIMYRIKNPELHPKYRIWLEKKLKLKELNEQFGFSLNAGSYLFGGVYPGHGTHRDGRYFDFSMGPDLMPFRTTKINLGLKEAYQYLRFHGSQSEKKLIDKYNGSKSIYFIERNPSDVDRLGKYIIHQYDLNRIVREVINNVAKGENIYEEELKIYGTPHFANSDSGELAHIGSMCLLLSAPQKILYGSPIIHIRCIHALREAAKKSDETEAEWNLTNIVCELSRFSSLSYFCYPSDHHNHWHVVYQKENPIENLEKIQYLWLKAGIDLSPFLDYLNSHTKDHLNFEHHSLQHLKTQFEDIQHFCQQYNDARNALFNDSSITQEEKEERFKESDLFVKDIFRPFITNHEEGTGNMLTPAIAGNTSKEIKTASKNLKLHIRELSRILQTHYSQSSNVRIRKRLKKILENLGTLFVIFNPEIITIEELEGLEEEFEGRDYDLELQLA